MKDNVTKEQINTSEKNINYLSRKIAIIAKFLQGKTNIDAAYLTTHQNSNNSNGTLHIYVLLNEKANYYFIKDLIEKIEDRLQMSSDPNIIISIDRTAKYTLFALNPSDIKRIERLIESTILFDKTGKLTKIKEESKDYGHLYPLHLVDYIPPIDTNIISEFTMTK